jgi:hypothetical protein
MRSEPLRQPIGRQDGASVPPGQPIGAQDGRGRAANLLLLLIYLLALKGGPTFFRVFSYYMTFLQRDINKIKIQNTLLN